MITHTFTKQVEFVVTMDESTALGTELSAVMARDPEFAHDWLDSALCIALSNASMRRDGTCGSVVIQGSLMSGGE